MPTYINIAAYKFVTLDDLHRRREELLALCGRLSLKGTIIVSPEGINMFVAGVRRDIDAFLDHVRSDPALADLEVKESLSDYQPFTRMLVKVKREIIAFGVHRIDPRQKTSPRVSAEQLKQWLDEGRDVALLDVRNNFEYDVGTFDKAIPVGVDDFRNFSNVIADLPDELKNKPVVTFCTGGIRCEKAGPLLELEGFSEVYQLDGGILKYFEEVGGEHYRGECFVFDKRVALDSELKETDTAQCYICQEVLTPEEQMSPEFVPGVSCPNCYVAADTRWGEVRERHLAAIRRVVDPLPGSEPYENIRPVHVPGRHDEAKVIDFLDSLTPNVSRAEWLRACEAGLISSNDRVVSSDDVVRTGERLLQRMPDTVEPDVNVDIRIIHEDEAILVIDKPAPLPMHPCGRFNRNTLGWILNQALQPTYPRSAHRLDANTSGVVVYSKTRRIAGKLQPQFERGEVEKRYLARVVGRPESNEFSSTKPIETKLGRAGSRGVGSNGQSARTDFSVVHAFDDGTTLIEARPKTGRTNQIRIHLWDLGLAILGDPLYRPNGETGTSQTLTVDDPPMCLHASRIAFTHPKTNDRVTFESHSPTWAIVD